MIVRCEQCGRAYDDAQRWTICPHPGLDCAPPRREPDMENGVMGLTEKTWHPAIGGIMQFFAYSHLPPDLAAASKMFCDLAEHVANGPLNAEATIALRKLLEAKDAAVRAVLFKR